MTQYGTGENSYLDDVRLSEGAEQCRTVFGELCEKDIRQAAGHLNDPRLTFGTLYMLSPGITQFHLERYMSPRNAAALRLVRAAGRPEGIGTGETARTAMKWMLNTGRADDGMSSEYEEAMDIAASVLINTYKDADALPAAVDMIFNRSRIKHNIHSLVWAVFQSRNPEALKLIAQRLRSPNERDARLACSLLGIEAENSSDESIRGQYEAYLQWLEDNDPFLYFTGESFQYTSRPAFYSIDFERRYLHRGTPRYDHQPVSPAGEEEQAALAAFKPLSREDQALLSGHSQRLHKSNPAEWKAWVQQPIEEQIRSAKLSRGSHHDYGFGKFV